MASKREYLISIIEEDLMILSEILGNLSRLGIRNPDRAPLISHTKKDIEWTMALRNRIKESKSKTLDEEYVSD